MPLSGPMLLRYFIDVTKRHTEAVLVRKKCFGSQFQEVQSVLPLILNPWCSGTKSQSSRQKSGVYKAPTTSWELINFLDWIHMKTQRCYSLSLPDIRISGVCTRHYYLGTGNWISGPHIFLRSTLLNETSSQFSHLISYSVLCISSPGTKLVVNVCIPECQVQQPKLEQPIKWLT